MDVFLKTRLSRMPFHPCVSGRYLAPGDGNDRCLKCLGVKHAEAAFVDESCSHCGKMTVAELRTRLRFLQRGGVPIPLPRSRAPPGSSQDVGCRMSITALEGEPNLSGDGPGTPSLAVSGRHEGD